jgi:hypothetical protein
MLKLAIPRNLKIPNQMNKDKSQIQIKFCKLEKTKIKESED